MIAASICQAAASGSQISASSGTRPPGIPRSGINGNFREYVFRKIPAGISFHSVFNLLILNILISSFHKCSYSARHNVKVRSYFVESIETLKKFVLIMI